MVLHQYLVEGEGLLGHSIHTSKPPILIEQPKKEERRKNEGDKNE